MDDDHTVIYNPIEPGIDFYITDKWDETLSSQDVEFHGRLWVAFVCDEVIEESDEREPGEHELLSDYDADIETAELRFKEKIKKKTNTKYFTNVYRELSIRNQHNKRQVFMRIFRSGWV